MTGQMAIIMATNARRSIGKRRDRSEKSRRLRINLEHDAPDKRSELYCVFASGNDGVGQDNSRDSDLKTRGWDAMKSA